jgi:Acyl-CoA reductase (LuxC)
MQLKERIELLTRLGNYLHQPKDERLETVIRKANHGNGWFSAENIESALQAIANSFLQKKDLEEWASAYIDLKETNTAPKTVALILAGNIPLVGFHDVLAVFVVGHKAKIKLSEKDNQLLPHLVSIMREMDARVSDYFEFVEGLMKGFDAVIATGSNNSARYFETYFAKYPNIIRKNRNAVAVLTGNESAQELQALGNDVTLYYGLGCRNVSKIYIHKGYNFHPLLEAIHEYREIVLNDKYKNNFDYQFTLIILNKIPHQANGCILMTENTAIASPIATLYYEYYDRLTDLHTLLLEKHDEIQCIVSSSLVVGRNADSSTNDQPERASESGRAEPKTTNEIPSFQFGEAQKPRLTDYADGVDTMAFLSKI